METMQEWIEHMKYALETRAYRKQPVCAVCHKGGGRMLRFTGQPMHPKCERIQRKAWAWLRRAGKATPPGG